MKHREIKMLYGYPVKEFRQLKVPFLIKKQSLNTNVFTSNKSAYMI